jgi:adenosine deaminase CECR1
MPKTEDRTFNFHGQEFKLRSAYKERRDYLMDREILKSLVNRSNLAQDVMLELEEQVVAARYAGILEDEIAQHSMNVRACYPTARHFWEWKSIAERSPSFEFIKRMPKGGVLHAHSSALAAPEELVEMTRAKNCYVFVREQESQDLPLVLRFFADDAAAKSYPTNPNEKGEWVSAEKVRAKEPGFDARLLKALTVDADDLDEVNVWKRFTNCFRTIGGIINYLGNATDYYRKVIQRLVDDNIQHVELRMSSGTLYDLRRSMEWDESIDESIRILQSVLKEFPGFTLKIIYCMSRSKTANDGVATQIQHAQQLVAKYPDMVVGFDMVGAEDGGHTTLHYLDEFLKLRGKLSFYFHDGESDWPHNENVFDALLLNTRRIGHGYNLYKYPFLMELVREVDMAIEICPISNQVLRFVSDLRDHPALTYLVNGVPITLSSDDPSIFGNHGLSYDFWGAAMSWKLDLRTLKKLASNSLKYSALTGEEKQQALLRWEKAWDEFIQKERQAIAEGPAR